MNIFLNILMSHEKQVLRSNLLESIIFVCCVSAWQILSHVFLCQFATVCWNSFFLVSWAWGLEAPTNVLQLLNRFSLQPKLNLLWVNGPKAIISKIWFERNQRIFEGSRRSSLDCFNPAKFKASQWYALSNRFSSMILLLTFDSLILGFCFHSSKNLYPCTIFCSFHISMKSLYFV